MYLGLYSYMSVQIYILVHEDIDGKMRTRRCCIADCFASERAKHALYASASQLSNNTYPEICLLSAWLYELNSAFSRLFLPYCLYQLVTQFWTSPPGQINVGRRRKTPVFFTRQKNSWNADCKGGGSTLTVSLTVRYPLFFMTHL